MQYLIFPLETGREDSMDEAPKNKKKAVSDNGREY
jgi:hypothetical protein